MKPPYLRFNLLALTAGVFLLAAPVQAYIKNGSQWPTGNIPMELQLGTPASPLSDGSTRWNDLALACLQEWNAVLGRVQFLANVDSQAPKNQGYGRNNVFFSDTIYGDAWDDQVNSITVILQDSTGQTTETDVLFNSNKSWDSYRGALNPNKLDFRRVALHEFGHVLGLDHPDQAQPKQTVDAIMNSSPGNTEHLTADDIAGAQFLYSDPAHPACTIQFASRSFSSGEKDGAAKLVVQRAGGLGNTVTVPYSIQDGSGVAGINYTPVSGTLIFSAGQSTAQIDLPLRDDGVVTDNKTALAVLGTPSTTATLGLVSRATVVIQDQDLPAGSQKMANISTRSLVGQGDNVMIAGFVLIGEGTRQVAIRAVGPKLSDYGVSGVIPDVTLDLRDASGNRIQYQDDWDEDQSSVTNLSANQQAIVGAGLAPSERQESVFIRTLSAGSYTAILNGDIPNATGTDFSDHFTGNALVEVYDLQNTTGPRLMNLSTRGQVGQGDNVMIGGFVVTGNTPQKVLVRVLGPDLASYGVSGALPDPHFDLIDAKGNVLGTNDNWKTGQQAEIQASGFAPQNDADSAFIATLAPGAYTAVVRGTGNTTGVALVEVYNLDN